MQLLTIHCFSKQKSKPQNLLIDKYKDTIDDNYDRATILWRNGFKSKSKRNSYPPTYLDLSEPGSTGK